MIIKKYIGVSWALAAVFLMLTACAQPAGPPGKPADSAAASLSESSGGNAENSSDTEGSESMKTSTSVNSAGGNQTGSKANNPAGSQSAGSSSRQSSSTAKPAPVVNVNYNPLAQQYAAVKTANPLKGFIPYKGSYNTIPYSMEWWYIPLKDLMNGENSYTFEKGLDPVLNEIAARGNQAVFRVYLDYPDKEDGTPSFIWNMGIRKYSYNNMGSGVYPDWTDQRLINILEKFIKEMGRRYDNDPRIAFITCGLVGHWGEWHNYPDTLMPTANQQFQLFKAFDTAFPTTKVMARYPDSPGLSNLKIGFHDDSFAHSTIGSENYFFYNLMKKAGLTERWKTEVIGGEFRPEHQTPFLNGTDYDYTECVNTTHCSWLIYHHAFSNAGLTSAQKQRANAASQQLGYELFIRSSAANISANAMEVSVEMENRGVAPFYYDWTMKVGVVKDQKLVKSWNTGWKLSGILPGSPQTYTAKWNTADLPVGSYSLVLMAENPLKNGKPLKFANTAQDAALSGWVTLGTASQP